MVFNTLSLILVITSAKKLGNSFFPYLFKNALLKGLQPSHTGDTEHIRLLYTGFIRVTKVENIAPRARLEPTLLATLGLVCKPLHYLFSLVQFPPPMPTCLCSFLPERSVQSTTNSRGGELAQLVRAWGM